mmetsp:Transcript_70570/g.161888  ORF Transcript_70570/g.161888 Transcript_70570/m.161888 type:complete len:212 (-) Transcript_70570:429-1064(-)
MACTALHSTAFQTSLTLPRQGCHHSDHVHRQHQYTASTQQETQAPPKPRSTSGTLIGDRLQTLERSSCRRQIRVLVELRCCILAMEAAQNASTTWVAGEIGSHLIDNTIHSHSTAVRSHSAGRRRRTGRRARLLRRRQRVKGLVKGLSRVRGVQCRLGPAPDQGELGRLVPLLDGLQPYEIVPKPRPRLRRRGLRGLIPAAAVAQKSLQLT